MLAMKSLHNLLTATVSTLCVAAVAFGGQPPDAPLRQFDQRIADYVALRRQAEAQTSLPRESGDPRDIEAAADALADAIRAARRHARAGDIFTADVATLFRGRIGAALREHGLTPNDLLMAGAEEAPGRPADLTVNGRFDWAYGALMPGCVIDALPPLPAELQYRFVAGDLVLIDVDAGLIVDVLSRALFIAGVQGRDAEGIDGNEIAAL
jgi:hypothetical protein